MGVSLAASARNTGYAVCWVSEGRSAATRERADSIQMTEFQSLGELCDACEGLVSVCPPHAASAMAAEVRACGFQGLYADVNAISPQRSRDIGQEMASAGIRYVDGGIIGGPAWKPGTTWLHLCGPEAEEVASWFSEGPLETRVMGEDIGRASALKMCFAAQTKGSTALLCSILAAADGLGVREELEQQWGEYDPDQAPRSHRRMTGVTAKAWRFAGEMEEIADTLESAGLPGGFHEASAEVYRRMSSFKEEEDRPELDDVIQALLNPSSGSSPS